MTIVKRLIWIGLLVVVAFVFFNIRLFSIPSGSMVPTVRVGDYVLVWKMRYGWSKYSLPFSPELFSGRIWPAEPARGDVIVFKDPRDSATDYIKRVVGLPGDRVRMQRHALDAGVRPSFNRWSATRLLISANVG